MWHWHCTKDPKFNSSAGLLLWDVTTRIYGSQGRRPGEEQSSQCIRMKTTPKHTLKHKLNPSILSVMLQTLLQAHIQAAAYNLVRFFPRDHASCDAEDGWWLGNRSRNIFIDEHAGDSQGAEMRGCKWKGNQRHSPSKLSCGYGFLGREPGNLDWEQKVPVCHCLLLDLR